MKHQHFKIVNLITVEVLEGNDRIVLSTEYKIDLPFATDPKSRKSMVAFNNAVINNVYL